MPFLKMQNIPFGEVSTLGRALFIEMYPTGKHRLVANVEASCLRLPGSGIMNLCWHDALSQCAVPGRCSLQSLSKAKFFTWALTHDQEPPLCVAARQNLPTYNLRFYCL